MSKRMLAAANGWVGPGTEISALRKKIAAKEMANTPTHNTGTTQRLDGLICCMTTPAAGRLFGLSPPSQELNTSDAVQADQKSQPLVIVADTIPTQELLRQQECNRTHKTSLGEPIMAASPVGVRE